MENGNGLGTNHVTSLLAGFTTKPVFPSPVQFAVSADKSLYPR
jgi:phosphoribosylcarboxyaminoimidazole (NCAIR) mutase